MIALLLLLIPAQDPVSFDRDVLPLLEKRCNRCHHAEKQRGGLDLSRIATIRRGGDELGAAIVPGKPDNSPLIQVLTGKAEPRMPEKGEPLSPQEIELLRRWVAEGAKDDSPVFPAEDVAFFEREIRPVLAGRCFKCHAGEDAEHGLELTSRQGILTGGSRGPAAVPGRPDQSLLMSAIRHTGKLRMPRGGDRLNDAQVEAFAAWIGRGLPWPGDARVLARKRTFTISDADRNHWSFRPLPNNLPPEWSIDRALEPHHRRLGLTPAPEADRHRLLRRVTYDLIGFPPTPDEIAAFVEDPAPNAFDKVVDRLLASPHFGRRWGRHWLDYTRNGANAQSNRGPAMDSRRYAEWVARMLNEDRPWDWFVRVHIAGDKMSAPDGRKYDPDQALAAAVPLNGPRTFEEIPTETFVLMDKLDEGIEFLGRSLMGISLECARCHDHKFDPISQRDYYALLGFFQSSGFAALPSHLKTQAEAEAALARFRKLTAEQARLNGFIRKGALLFNVRGGGRIKKWMATRVPILAPVDRRLKEIEIEILEGELRNTKEPGLARDLRTSIADRRAFLGTYAPPDYLAGGGAILGKYSHVIGGHKSRIGLLPRAKTLGLTSIARELEAQMEYWKKERSRWGERKRFGGFTRKDPEAAELARANERVREIETEIGFNFKRPWLSPGTSRLYVRVDGGYRRAEDLKALDEKAKAAGLQFNSNNQDRVWLHPHFIGDARLLLRGDVLHPDRIIPRGTPVFLGELKTPLEGSGRLQLARWLTAPDSIPAALVARAAVNRAWRNLLGEALCRTPKELGRLGETPELPEVIDGLSARFISGGWSMKGLIREIVTSGAYRRSAVGSERLYTKDPRNRFFARQAVRRLEFEPIVNTMAWIRTGKRHAAINDRDFARHFDAPSIYDLLDRRVASISATQALFLMNQGNSTRGIARSLSTRLGLDDGTDIASAVQRIYEHTLQRPPSDEELAFARGFVDRRRESARKLPSSEGLREFAWLLLSSNELFYLE